MRRLYAILFLVILSAGTFAQSPQKMSYQAVIRNSSDQLVNTHAVGMRISILQGTETGAAVYVETQIPTTNTNGLVSIEIGEGTPVSGIFADIDWSAGPYFLKTETDPAGGTSYSITGTSQLLSVPYSLYSKTAENFVSGTSTGDMQYWNGSSWVLLPRGEAGQVLTINDSDIPQWKNATSVSLLPAIVTNVNSTNVHEFTATISGTVNPNGLMTSVYIEYGLTTSYGVEEWYEEDYLYGNSDIIVSINLPQENGGHYSNPFLIPGTTYHYRMVVENPVGITRGPDMTFTTATTTVTVGQSYQEGIVAYIFHPDDPGYVEGQTHGLVAAPGDQSTGIQWYNGSYTTIGAYGQDIGTGNSNTNMIVANQGVGSYAAKLCYDLVLGAYSNWYLPSHYELDKILSNKLAIGGFADEYYWSSTEDGQTTAHASDDEGSGWAAGKEETLRVRAIHSF